MLMHLLHKMDTFSQRSAMVTFWGESCLSQTVYWSIAFCDNHISCCCPLPLASPSYTQYQWRFLGFFFFFWLCMWFLFHWHIQYDHLELCKKCNRWFFYACHLYFLLACGDQNTFFCHRFKWVNLELWNDCYRILVVCIVSINFNSMH